MLMNFKRILMVYSLASGLCFLQGLAQQSAAKASTPQTSAEQDGQPDFDFELGTWKIHLKRLLHPLTGSKTWIEFDGTSVTRKVWDGRAQIEEFETDSSTGAHRGLDAAPVQFAISSVESLLGEQQRWRDGSSTNWPIQRWYR